MTNPSPIGGNAESVQRLLELSDPLISIEVLVQAIRHRFSQEFSSDPVLPWKWVEDPKTTGIFIESGFDEHTEARNTRPGIWVDRTQSTTDSPCIGYQDQHPEIFRTGARRYIAVTYTDIVIDCTAENRGESMLVASVVHMFLLMTRDPIMAHFGIRDISPIVVNRTTPYERDKELWNTPIMFRIGAETRWNDQKDDPLINAVTVRVAERVNPDSFRLMQLNAPENTPTD